MSSSDEFSLAEFGLAGDGETWADDGNVPEWNFNPESLPQTNEVQWPQYEQQTCMWQEQTSPAYQPTFNQVPSMVPVPVMHAVQSVHTTPHNFQFLQNCQYLAMNTSAQYQQIPVNHLISKTNQPTFHNVPSKHHRAQITLVHNTNGPSRAIIKRKRKRTAFTTEQILALEKVFRKKPYVNRDERQALVEQLQVTDRAVKVWFQNRRIKSKREELEALEASSDYSPMGATDSSDSFGLAYVEAQITQKTDEYGYVTLDDRAIGELVSVIDGLVGEKVDCDILSEVDVVENVLKMEYEPVSPAANSDCSDEDAAKWRRPDPEQSLRQLLDIQHFC
ncbi:homeobox protein not2-like [Cydia amplana]|uniref:homeobox protein not2-like n=1 Tax=Cydia amplana TaxID=1869771 RepID=UPI002FE53F5B